MTDLVGRVARRIDRDALVTPGDTLLVAVSGGADSLVLLHVLTQLREALALRLHVATLDHGLRGTVGADDAAFVRQTAESWGISVTVGRADVRAQAGQRHLSLEEAARQVRYAFLLRVARHIGAWRVAVAHNRDDQAETVLMHLIRGSGLSGLRGMLPATPLDAYHLLEDAPVLCDPPLSDDPADAALWPVLVRPLLTIPRTDIDTYAATHELTPRQDATNADRTFFRNRLRHEVIPLLETLNPNVRALLARTADVLRADAELVAATGEAALGRALRPESTSDAIILDRGTWDTLSLSEKRHVVRAAVGRLRPDLRDVSFEHVAAACHAADSGATGAQATLPGGLMLRADYETLVIADAEADPLLDADDAPALEPGQATRFQGGEHVRHVCGAWVFESEPLPPGTDLASWHADPLAAALRGFELPLLLRTRRPGDRFRPHGMGGHRQKLSDTLINMRVPAAWRDRVPLLATQNDSDILWVVVPTPEGTRGRVGDQFAVSEPSPEPLIGVRWRRV